MWFILVFNYLSCIFIQYCRVRSGEIGWLKRCIYNYRHDGANYLVTLSDKIGRRLTLILCGCWMAVSIASFCLTSGVVSVIAIQLFLVYLPTQFLYIFYATASDYAPAGAIGTANSLITVAQYVGGAVAPIIMGYLLTSFGGWHSHQGYIWCFLLMSCCAFIGVILQMILGYLIKKKNQNKLII